MTKIGQQFFEGNDVVAIAKNLLGKELYSSFDGIVTGGVIVETEAYCGETDRACHAFGGKRTPRTEVMFQEGGRAYVYLCYGIHSLFNIVTNKENRADAVLIRAIEPTLGLEEMLRRRQMKEVEYRLTAGPGALGKALGFATKHTGLPVFGETIWLEDQGGMYSDHEILASARVGVAYAGEDAFLPWRFRINKNPWCSKAK
ncbi:DNA-3-methyladenine glycosylase [Flammeovirgaceae bacterium SG7u.111]|nr:DNA-3-methyladenine glycosylase [Flammeovirgaceae bacterium SG7u.132]WPO37587.1 DNA-3-methyladenine glycosylase [Flammeovirgaceae bacterium SG7u.111]